jgi:hypothetical protein
MTDIQPAPEKEEEEKSIAPSGMAPWKLELGKALWVWMSGGASLGSLVTILNTTELPKIAIGGLVGGAMTGGGAIGYAIVGPTLKKTKKGADRLGEGIASVAGEKANDIVGKVLGIDDRYLELQKEDCQTSLCDGITQVFTPLLEEIFVPLSVTFTARDPGWEERENKAREDDGERLAVLNSRDAQIWQCLKMAEKSSSQGASYRRMAILAWGGYGKTTLLRHIAYIYSSKQQNRYGVKAKIPVFLALKTYGKIVAETPALSLPDVIMKHHIPRLSPDLNLAEDWAKSKLQDGEVVLLLDGFDEVAESIRPQVAQWLKRELKNYPKSIAILTSRPKAYDDQPMASKLAMLMRIWVEPFTPPQQEAFITKWYDYQEVYGNNGRSSSDVKRRAKEKAAKLLGQIRERPEIEDLAKIPLLLNMIATFHLLSPKVQLPKRKVELYQAICKLQLLDRPGAKELDTLLTETDAQTVLQRLALEMMLNGREKTIEREILLNRLSKYLAIENETVNAGVFLQEVVRVSELLVERESNEYEFAHWSFQEYLAAKELFNRKQEKLVVDRLAVPEWKPIILMYSSLLKNPSGLIRIMVDRGLIDLARACLQETTKKVDLSLEQELNQLNQQVAHSTYTRLEALLKAGKWEEADRETEKVMLQVAEQEERGFLMPDDLKNFPCEDLLAIDRLWVAASKGHFGFSVQKKIWEACESPMGPGNDWDRFCDRVGWKQKGKYVNYSALRKDPLHSPAGELPSNITNENIDTNQIQFSFLAHRLVNCSTHQS